MKTLGATPGQIARLVEGEALVIAVLSWVAAVILAVPLSLLVGRTVGTLAFRVRLPLVIDVGAVAAWLVLVAAIAVVAAWLPARRASKLTVCGALGQV
jgi:putative ABC transport system permease protein